MFELLQRFRAQPAHEESKTPAPEPVELGAEELRQVGGGSPHGSWGADSTDPTQSPHGSW